MQVTINFHDTKEELPEKSGVYIVISESGFLSTLGYSSVHEMFNVTADHTDTEIKVKAWAEIPPELKGKVREV